MNTDVTPQATEADREHVKLLSIFHFVLAALLFLIGCFPTIHIVFGLMLANARVGGPNPPPPELGYLFASIGALVMLFLWSMAGLMAFSGLRLLQHRSRLFCMIVAGVSCLSFPLGTILGVFTLIVLSRPSVRQMFGGS